MVHYSNEINFGCYTNKILRETSILIPSVHYMLWMCFRKDCRSWIFLLGRFSSCVKYRIFLVLLFFLNCLNWSCQMLCTSKQWGLFNTIGSKRGKIIFQFLKAKKSSQENNILLRLTFYCWPDAVYILSHLRAQFSKSLAGHVLGQTDRQTDRQQSKVEPKSWRKSP